MGCSCDCFLGRNALGPHRHAASQALTKRLRNLGDRPIGTTRFQPRLIPDMPSTKTASKSATVPPGRTGHKAYQHIERVTYKAAKQFAKLAHRFPDTDFRSCEDYPYPGHLEVFEDTYRKLAEATKGRATITKFGVLSYRYGYMAMEFDLNDDVSATLAKRIDTILRAGEKQSGRECTICGARLLSLDHLKATDPYHGFCTTHSQDEIDAVFEAEFDIEAAVDELGIDLT